MTYRKFLKVFRRARRTAVPDIRARLPKEQKPLALHTPLLRRAVAIAAVAALLIGGGWLLQHFGKQFATPPTEPIPSLTHPAPSEPIFETVEVIPALHDNTPIEALGAAACGSVISFAYTDTIDEAHTECSGVYYDLQAGTVFCCTHAVRELLREQGIAGENVRVKHFIPQTGKVLFTLDDVEGHPSYCGDLIEDTLLPVQADLYMTGTWMGGTDMLFSAPYALIFVMDDSNALLLIDMDTAEVFRLSDTYAAMEDATLTRGGQYVHYTLQNSDCHTAARTTVLYDIETSTFRTFVGEVLDGLPDDSLLILRTPEGVRVYDCETGETLLPEQTALPNPYLYGVCVTERLTIDTYTLAVEDRSTGEMTPLETEYIYAFAQSADRQYLYYYVRGESTMHVRHMLTGQETTLPVDERLVSETESDVNSGKMVCFTLTVSPVDGSLLLEYNVTPAARPDPEAVRQEREQSPWWNYHNWFENGGRSIASMADLLRRFPDGVTAYEGDGYLYLDFTAIVTDDPQALYVKFEDYRDGWGYDLTHAWNSPLAPINQSETWQLSAEDEKTTRDALAAAGIPILEADDNYRTYLRGGKLNTLSSHLAGYRTDNIFADIGCYFLYDLTIEDTDSRWGLESAEDMAELREFLTFTDDLSYVTHFGNSVEFLTYLRQSTYKLSLSGNVILDIYIGKNEGKPFVMKDYCLAYISEAEFNKWNAWMTTQYPKGFVEPPY